MPATPTVRVNGHAIRAFAVKDNLTIAGLAKLAGIAGSAVHCYVHGTKRPSRRNAHRLAQALGVPVQAICMDDLADDQRMTA